MQQHSQQWWDARCGRVTASRIGDLMARNKPAKGKTMGEWSARHNNYLAEKVAERITRKNRDRKKVASLDHRLDLEPDARAAYEFYYEAELEQVGFIEHPRIPDAGSSPDSLVGTKGGLEIKCPDAHTHIEILTSEHVDLDYLYQCQFGMACTDRLWWDFVSFNPDFPEELKLYRKRIDRNDELIAEIETNVIEFLEEVDQKVAQVRALMRGSTPLEHALESSLESIRLVH